MRAYLHQHAHLTAAELAQTLAAFRPCTFRKGTELFHPGPPPDRLYFIETGLARAYRLVRGEDITSAFYGTDSFCFDTLSIVAQVPTELYVECLTDVQAHEILIPDLNRLFRRVPPIERLGRRINENLVCGLTERLRAFQMDDLRTRYLALLHQNPELIRQVPQRHIATYLGVKPESLSRMRAQL
jgi:CRP/FNR family transcriptional regulator, anaerobic regulatory protein